MLGMCSGWPAMLSEEHPWGAGGAGTRLPLTPPWAGGPGSLPSSRETAWEEAGS